MRLPNCGPRPHTSHTFAIFEIAPKIKLQLSSLAARPATHVCYS
jgi:hypothetical protein